MSFLTRKDYVEGDDHCYRFSLLHEDDDADQQEEYQSQRSELPAEIPDSQPSPYLPAEIPDSQPETNYRADLSFTELDYSELSSQLPTRDQGDLWLGDAEAFNLGDYDLGEEGPDISDRDNLANQENIDPHANSLGRVRQEGTHDREQQGFTSVDTEIVTGGTRLTKRHNHHLPLHTEGINCNGRLPSEAPQYKGLDEMEEDSTQPATQLVVRKDGFDCMLSEQDEADVICILLPTSPAAHAAVELTAAVAPQHILQNYGMSHISEAPEEEIATDTGSGDESKAPHESITPQLPDPNQPKWNGSAKDIALRFSSKVHDLALGFTFGRNPKRCDLLLSDEHNQKVSNRHFRIFMKTNGSLMIEDTSTNGTRIDATAIAGPKARDKLPNFYSQYNLCNGTTIELPPLAKDGEQTIRFTVKMPQRDAGQEKYNENCEAYIRCVEQAERQHFLVEGTRNGNAPDNMPDPARPGAFLAAATGGHAHGVQMGRASKYNVVTEIGQGAFATVYKVSTKRDGLVYAAKEINKSRLIKDGNLSSKLYNELNLIMSLRHPNIVKYVDHHETNKSLFIIMEYVHQGDLSVWTRQGQETTKKTMPEFMCMHVARQILQAIDYLHQRGITHRDLKPDNILQESDCPFVFKLSDFGLSKIVTNTDTFLKTFCGTMMYCAPEVYPGYQRVKASVPSKRPYADVKPKYDHTFPYERSVDIWGLGAVLYHLLSGYPPFTAEHDPQGEDMLWQLLHTPVNWERLRMVGISQSCIDFLSRMLVTEATGRDTDEELLNHPWIGAAQGPADESDCVLSDPAERLNAHASQLSIGDEDEVDTVDEGSEDPPPAKRHRSWVPDVNRNAWGETPSMVARNVQREDRIRDLQADMGFPMSSDIPGPSVGVQPQTNRLFGEIGSSALASSGALGFQGNRALQVQGNGEGSYDASFDALYDVSRAGTPDRASADANLHGGSQHHNPQHSSAPGAPSLLGAEALVNKLNMASTGSGESAKTDDSKPITLALSKDPESPSSRPSVKPSSQDMLPPETKGPSKRMNTTSVEHVHGEVPNTFEGYPPARRASTEDLGHKSVSPISKSDSRGSNNGAYQEGQQSRGAYTSNYDLPSTVFNSRESSAEVDVVMKDDGDSEDEVSRLEEALAAAKAKKAAKVASRTNSRSTSSHGDTTSTTHQPMTGIEVHDATAHQAKTATGSFVKPALRFGKLQPTRGSIHTPTIYITERLTTYGRHPDSTFVHPDPREDRVPKQALDIQMWYSGIETDIATGKTNWMNHPKLEAIIRTRASHFVLVNGVMLTKGVGEYRWGRLRTGDEITVAEPKPHATSARDKEYLRFRCEFFVGLSKEIRKPGEPKFVVEVEKEKFKVAEERKSRESSTAAAFGASKEGAGTSGGNGKIAGPSGGKGKSHHAGNITTSKS